MGAISAIILLGCLSASFACARQLVVLLFDLNARHGLPNREHIRQVVRDRCHMIISAPLPGRFLKRSREQRRAEELRREMPNVLRLLSIALESGSSISTALRYAANNSSGALADELKRSIWDIDAGQGFDEALEKLRNRTGGSEFAFLATAMEIQHRSGGSLADILDNVSEMLKQSSELEEDLQTKTAQGRLSSRIVALMPFALLAILSFFSPGYLGGFLASPLGACLFITACLLELLGFFLVRRALVIDFSADLEGSA